MQIKKLEQELGVYIFERFQKSVLVTQIGQQIIDKAQELLNLSNDIKNLSTNFQQPKQQLFKIGIFPTLAQYLLLPLIHTMQQEHETIQIYPVEEKSKRPINSALYIYR